jgi:hypothetical protein
MTRRSELGEPRANLAGVPGLIAVLTWAIDRQDRARCARSEADGHCATFVMPVVLRTRRQLREGVVARQRMFPVDSLWGDMDHVQQVIELKLRDGRILRPLLVDESGMLLGRVVGGQDGVVPLTESPETDDVIAVRRIDGVLRSSA